jgi:hypothetical protein
VKKEPGPVPVYQLKVTLQDINPPIWQRIQVSGDITLFKLHKILQAAMEWQDYHLHQFIVGEDYYAIPSPEDPWPMETKNEKRTKLFQIAPVEKARFNYEYDFGDSWHHNILVEKILHPEQELEHPICLAGKRSRPPEDTAAEWADMKSFWRSSATLSILSTRIRWSGQEKISIRRGLIRRRLAAS